MGWKTGSRDRRAPDHQQVVSPRQSALVCAGWPVLACVLSQMHGMMAYDTSMGAGELHGRGASGMGDDLREESIQWRRHGLMVYLGGVCRWCAGMVIVRSYVINEVEVVRYNSRYVM